MTPRKIKIRQIDKSEYVIYGKKAQEFYQTMFQAEKAGNWNAVGLNAVHCAISASDALLIKFVGKRSISDDHMVVVDLLLSSIKLSGIKEKANSLRKIIAEKNLIEYENRNFTRKDAQNIIKRTERFYHWAIEILK